MNGHHERQMVWKLVGGSTQKNGQKKGCLLPLCFPRILATRVHSSRFTVSDILQCHPSIPTEKKHVNGDHGDKPWDSSVVSNKKPELAMATNIKQTIC
jgi:hypothetical protein